jgi:single-strand DNA-binding protein
MINTVTLMGRMVRNPELRTTPNGIEVCSFSIAVDKTYNKDKPNEANFFDIVAWRGSATFVSKYFAKGDMIALTGELQQRRYTDKEGKNHSVVEIIAQNLSFCGNRREDEAKRQLRNDYQSDKSSANYGNNNAQNPSPSYYGDNDGDDGDLPF